MRRHAPLQLQQLEERDVPAATMFSNISGIVETSIVASGSTLYFVASNANGYELYAANGTSSNVHAVSPIGFSASDPNDVITPAGDGILYFTYNNGNGDALWRTDGTATGTVQVPAIPPEDTMGTWEDPTEEVGLNGDLYFITTDNATGMPQLWVTNGSTNTLLTNIPNPGWTLPQPQIGVLNGEVSVTEQVVNWTGVPDVWVTDGTPAGTKLIQVPLNTNPPPPLPPDGEPPTYDLPSGNEVSPGLLVYAAGAGLWSSDGVDQTSVQQIATIPGNLGGTTQNFVWMGGKLYFIIDSANPSNAGLWVTDGTAAGTQRVDVSLGSAANQPISIQAVGDKLLIVTGSQSSLNQIDSGQTGPVAYVEYWLTDGTAARTNEVVAPAGATGKILFDTSFAGDNLYPDGILLFQNDNRLWMVNVQTAQSTWVDPTGLPSGFSLPAVPQTFSSYYYTYGDGFYNPTVATYFNGALYFTATNGVQQPELWQWDLPVPVTTVTPVSPAVTSVVVNDGAVQRSMVTILTVTFSRQVNLESGAVSVTNSTGQAIQLILEPQTVNGVTVLTITFTGPAVIGGSVPDGRYTLTINAADVIDAATGGVMQMSSTTAFTRLFGDLLGNGTYDRDARWMVQDALGSTIGSPGYIAAIDFNGDGVIDEADVLAVVRYWGKTLPAA